jgi:RNA polymerase sigma-32 factor
MSKDISNKNLPTLTPEGSFASYLAKIRKFPMLDAAEEYVLAKNWRDKGDKESAHKLVTSHLRLVAKIAMGYRGYGLPVSELVSEGNIGLMQAVKKFDPEKGFRLATYAMWWIKAAIQEYVLRSWSLVKIGTTSAQKKLFFNLKKIKNQIFAAEQGNMLPEHVTEIANQLDVREDEVVSMNQRLAGHEHSLNAHVGNEEGDAEWQDWVVDTEADQELQISQRQELQQRQELLKKALHVLDEREKDILYDRRLIDEPKTLEELSQKYNISRERIRQIENKAFEKVQKAMLENIKQPKQLTLN